MDIGVEQDEELLVEVVRCLLWHGTLLDEARRAGGPWERKGDEEAL